MQIEIYAGTLINASVLYLLHTHIIILNQALFGLFQLGFITIFLSEPLVSGYTTGAAVHVFTSQLRHIFGLRIHTPTGLLSVPKVCKRGEEWLLYGQWCLLTSSCFLTIGKIGRIHFELKIQPLHSLCKARGPVLGRPFTPRVYLSVSPIFFYDCKIKYGISQRHT